MVPLWRNAFPSTSGLVWDWRKVKNLDSWLLRLLEDDEKFNEELKHHTESHVLQFLLGSNQNSNLEFGRLVVDLGPFKASFQRMPTLGNCAFVTQFLEAEMNYMDYIYGAGLWTPIRVLLPLDHWSPNFSDLGFGRITAPTHHKKGVLSQLTSRSCCPLTIIHSNS